MTTRVGLVKGDDRFANVLQALENAGDEVKARVRGRVLVKINAVMGQGSPADTHPDALRAVLEFLKPLAPERIQVGEAAGRNKGLFEGGYAALRTAYDFELLDFDTTGYEELVLLAMDGTPLPARLTRAHRQFDCLISLSLPKAHSDAVVTLSGKNMMGFVAGDEQWKVHGARDFSAEANVRACTRVIHRNLRTLLRHVRPDVAVLDGFHSFEGGPVPQCARGDRVEPRLAVAGADFVAVDAVAATVLGFRPQQVGYLVYSAEDGYGTADLSRIEIVGTPIAEASFPLQPPPRLEVLLDWRD